MVSWKALKQRINGKRSERSPSSRSTAPVQPVTQRNPSPQGRRSPVTTAQSTILVQPATPLSTQSPQGPHRPRIASATADQAAAPRQPIMQPVTTPRVHSLKAHRDVYACCGKGRPSDEQLAGWLSQDGSCVAYCHSSGRKDYQVHCDTLYVLRRHSGQYQHIENLLAPKVTAQIKAAYRKDELLSGFRIFSILQEKSGSITGIGMLRKIN